MAKVHRKIRKGGRQGPSAKTILLVMGGAALVVAVIIVLASGALNRRGGLEMCGSVPCPVKGDPKAPVTFTEVSDYNCSHCRDYARDTEPKIDEQYIKTGKVRYIVHSFGLSPETQGIAAAALCAADQNKFFEYHALLFQNQGKSDPNSLSLYAQQAGMDVPKFADCVNSGKYVAALAASSQAATAAGVTATPSFFINGKLIVGALPFQCKPGTPECAAGDFQTQIEAALKHSQ